MKKILVLTFYFEPDLCAGSFRNTPLVEELSRQSHSKNIEIDVITTMPNRYSTFAKEAPREEKRGNVRIERIEIPTHQSGIADQALSYIRFYRNVKKIIKSRSYDLVYASSSRLFTAYLGAEIARKKKVPLYLDVRDIFVDTIQDVVKNKIVTASLHPALKVIERSAFKNASHINLISPGFGPYFEKYDRAEKTFFTHGIDPLFLNLNQTDTQGKQNTSRPVNIIYAGNIGDGQGLDKIIPPVASRLEGKVKFTIVGDGGKRKALEKVIQEMKIKNVVLKKPVSREELTQLYKNSDYLFIHLNDYDAFKKVLPSKIFELGAIGKPLIAGVNGYARTFIEKHLPDAILFDSGDSGEFVRKLNQHLSEADTSDKPDRSSFIQTFDRDRINREMANSILSYL
jgi:hypothetical protein